MSKSQDLQNLIRLYKENTGIREVDMRQVAIFARDIGYPLAEPKDPLDLLAKDLARAAREETRQDELTGRQYRVHHAVPAPGGQFTFWVDIDENPPRSQMVRSLTNRREQMVGDGFSLVCDAEHWNRCNSDQEPIQIELDFTFDVELRMNHVDEEEEAS